MENNNPADTETTDSKENASFMLGNKLIKLDLNITKARKLKDKFQLDVFNDDFFDKIGADFYLMIDAVYEIADCGMTTDEFAANCSGQVFNDMTLAFMGAVINFIPPERAEILKNLTSSSLKINKAITRKMLQRAKQLDKTADGI